MNGNANTARPIDPATRQAAAWFARLRADDVKEQDRQAFEQWLNADARHRAAYAGFERFWSGTGVYAGEPETVKLVREAAIESALPDSAAHHAKLTHTKPALRINRYYAAAAGVLLAIAGTFVLLQKPGNGSYHTDIGKQRSYVLEDGSRITLNTNTLLHVAYSEQLRKIQLERGQAYFQVAKDKARAFVVETSDGTIRALGTEFDIDRHTNETIVTLIEGKVGVKQSQQPEAGDESDTPPKNAKTISNTDIETTPSAPEQLLRPGDRLSLTPDRPAVIERAALESSTAWLSRKLVFNDEPLGKAVEQVNRYSKQKVLIGDHAVRDLRISGVFRTGENAEFVHAITTYFGVRTERDGMDNYILLGKRER